MTAIYRAAVLAITAVFLCTPAARAELKLMMFEQQGCAYCIMWHNEIGPIYPKTSEGRAAPLVTQMLREELPEDVAIKSQPIFTPTFILLRDGQEIWRLEGYPGEDFFWGLLGKRLREEPEWIAAAGGEG
jgi:thioredoxin-related protein